MTFGETIIRRLKRFNRRLRGSSVAEEKIIGGLERFEHELCCNASRTDPIGLDGCSCRRIRESIDTRHGRTIKCVAMPQRYIDAGEQLMREERAKQAREK